MTGEEAIKLLKARNSSSGRNGSSGSGEKMSGSVYIFGSRWSSGFADGLDIEVEGKRRINS